MESLRRDPEGAGALIDIEVRLGQAWNPEIRPMVREACKNYSVGQPVHASCPPGVP
ncbi:hypothetical protein AB0L71_29265 [Streptomyces sp. NPDC052052]|uniref:hypothetical protein n=1 Tax=Streptomyces sp. NPDC052052 TaxID=3154756 RepID=UPI0034246A5F